MKKYPIIGVMEEVNGRVSIGVLRNSRVNKPKDFKTTEMNLIVFSVKM